MRPQDKRKNKRQEQLLQVNNLVNKNLITKNKEVNILNINKTIKTTKRKRKFNSSNQIKLHNKIENSIYSRSNILKVKVNNKWNECNIKASKKPFNKTINKTLISKVYFTI